MCWTFFFFWCSCIQPVLMLTTSWDLVTSPAVFGKEVELRCTVVGNASCCSKYTRIWSKGSKTILINGNPSLPSKYNETIDAANKQFSLIIYHLSKEDVDVVYTCAYGNISPQKTLTQNDSFEYHPTESECPVKIHNGELVGTLIVNMSAPHPSVTAQYGDSNFTSNLTTIITPVAGSTKFYTINSSLKGKATCRNNENFTLSVLTGVTTTNICNNVTLCTVGIDDGERWKFEGWWYLWLIHGTILTLICLLIVFRLFPDVQIQNENCSGVNCTDLTLKCTVTSFFPVTHVYLDGNADSSISCIERISFCTTRVFFVLDRTTLSDAGTYTCFAKSCVRTGQSPAITLNVTESDDQKYPGQKKGGDDAPCTDPACHTKLKRLAVYVSAVLNVGLLIAVGLDKCPDDECQLVIQLAKSLGILLLLSLPLLLLFLWVKDKLNLICHKKTKRTGMTSELQFLDVHQTAV